MLAKGVQFSIFAIQTILICVGTISNTLSFIVWTKGKICRTLPIALYFRILAAVDTFILLVPGVELLLYMSPYGIPLRNLNSVFCRLYPGLTQSSIRISSWVISSFTIERTLYIYFPAKFRMAQNSGRTLIITTCLVVSSVLMDLPIFIRSELLTVIKASANTTVNETMLNYTHIINSTTGTAITRYCDGNILKAELIIDAVTTFLLPFIILVSCNTLILIQFRRQYRFTMNMGSQKGHVKRQTRYRNAIYQIVSISFVHCLSTAPWAVVATCENFGCASFRYFDDLLISCNALVYLNSAVNVFLYCFIGNDFRNDLKALFCSKKSDKTQISAIVTQLSPESRSSGVI